MPHNVARHLEGVLREDGSNQVFRSPLLRIAAENLDMTKAEPENYLETLRECCREFYTHHSLYIVLLHYLPPRR